MLPDRADYYAIIAKAASALDSADARRRLYERARAALNTHVRRATPPLNQSDILAAQISLEEAIGMVEAEAQRDRGSRHPAETPSTFGPPGSIAAPRRDRDNWLSELLARVSREDRG